MDRRIKSKMRYVVDDFYERYVDFYARRVDDFSPINISRRNISRRRESFIDSVLKFYQRG